MKTLLFHLVLLAVLFSACSDKDGIQPSEPTFPGSAWISVLDTDGVPVQNVLVKIGEKSDFTNEDGQILFRDIPLTKSTYLTAEKNGYFNGSRRFFASEGQVNHIEIRLMTKQEAGSFQSTSAATINVDDKSSIIFQENSVVYATGGAYSGIVHVEAAPIHADDPNLSQKMPGNLLSLDEDDNLLVLQSYGMLAVELKSEDGIDLQLAPGKTAEIRMELPQHMVDAAPATIPLWYFDEETGYWVEDGQATLQGNEYVGEVGHFTLWNVDVFDEAFIWEGSFEYDNGDPAAGIEICLTIVSNGSQACGYTNESGGIISAVPLNQGINVDVKAPCGKLISTYELSPLTSDVKEPVRTIRKEEADFSTIKGKVLECDNVPLSQGHVRISVDTRTYLFDINQDGTFEHTILACDDSKISVRFVDEENAKMSEHFLYHAAPVIDVETMVACDELDLFIIYGVEGVSRKYVFITPESLLNYYPDHTTVQISSWNTNRENHISLAFHGTSAGSYPDAVSLSPVNLPNGSIGYISDFSAEVSEFGDVGGYIKGTFTGKVSVPVTGPFNLQMEGAFSVIRSK